MYIALFPRVQFQQYSQYLANLLPSRQIFMKLAYSERLLSAATPKKESDDDRVVSSHHQATIRRGENSESRHHASLRRILPALRFLKIWESVTIPLPNIRPL